MARQKGTITLSGRIGNIVFYETPHGKLARSVGSLDKKRLAGDPAFQATRETGTEFSRISSAGKLLRHAVRPFAPQAKDYSTHYRLNRLLVAILQEEPVHPRGHRRLSYCGLQALQGFEFQPTAPFHSRFRASYTVSVDRAGGVVEVAVAGFDPQEGVNAPAGATHCQLTAIGLAPDFDQEQILTAADAFLPWALPQPVPAGLLTCELPAATPLPLILCLGIRFYQSVNGKLYPLKEGSGLVVAGVWT